MIFHAYNDTAMSILYILLSLSLVLSVIAIISSWRIYIQSKIQKALEEQDPGHCHGKPDEPEPELLLDMWVARSLSGEIRLFPYRPHRILGIWDLTPGMYYQGIFGSIQLPIGSFPGIKATDEEPAPVTVAISLTPPF